MIPDNANKTYSQIGTPCVFLTGPAGSGKSTLLQHYAESDPSFGLFTSSTGIAAINLAGTNDQLNATTVHSALGFFDANTARAAYNDGWLHKAIRKKLKGLKWLVIDESPMLPGTILQAIYDAVDEVNADHDGVVPPVGILLTGDLFQLSPVQDNLMVDGRVVLNEKTHRPQKAPIDFAFNAKCWPEFEKGMIRLEKIWRQDNPLFLKALAAIRVGNGTIGAQFLKLAGVKFFNSPEEAEMEELMTEDYGRNGRMGVGVDATVICGTNKMVDKINLQRLDAEPGESFVVESKRWHARKFPPQEWKHIPDAMELKIGALVMILTNLKGGAIEGGGDRFACVNGDLGRIVGVVRLDLVKIADVDEFGIDAAKEMGETAIAAIKVQLLRDDSIVTIPQITRHCWQFNSPQDWEIVQHEDRVTEARVPGARRKVHILGELTYFPLRLAYASTVEKTQGLTLDRIQIRLNDWCLGMPQKMYVALSRCRTPEGISVVGTPYQLAKMVRIHDELRRFL